MNNLDKHDPKESWPVPLLVRSSQNEGIFSVRFYSILPFLWVNDFILTLKPFGLSKMEAYRPQDSNQVQDEHLVFSQFGPCALRQNDFSVLRCILDFRWIAPAHFPLISCIMPRHALWCYPYVVHYICTPWFHLIEQTEISGLDLRCGRGWGLSFSFFFSFFFSFLMNLKSMRSIPNSQQSAFWRSQAKWAEIILSVCWAANRKANISEIQNVSR